jgi:hypothetical protein
MVGPTKPFAKTAEIMSPQTGSALSGDLSAARRDHTATLLLSGKVLIVGGLSEETHMPLSSAESFDPTLGYSLICKSLDGSIRLLCFQMEVLWSSGAS